MVLKQKLTLMMEMKLKTQILSQTSVCWKWFRNETVEDFWELVRKLKNKSLVTHVSSYYRFLKCGFMPFPDRVNQVDLVSCSPSSYFCYFKMFLKTGCPFIGAISGCFMHRCHSPRFMLPTWPAIPQTLDFDKEGWNTKIKRGRKGESRDEWE